jgi:1,4-dihydroxy-2-naphthoyl-CoA synthase
VCRILRLRQINVIVVTITNVTFSLADPSIAIAKRSFNADSENIRGIGGMGMQALTMYYASEESKEGVRAFNEKRKPDFRKYQK